MSRMSRVSLMIVACCILYIYIYHFYVQRADHLYAHKPTHHRHNAWPKASRTWARRQLTVLMNTLRFRRFQPQLLIDHILSVHTTQRPVILRAMHDQWETVPDASPLAVTHDGVGHARHQSVRPPMWLLALNGVTWLTDTHHTQHNTNTHPHTFHQTQYN